MNKKFVFCQAVALCALMAACSNDGDQDVTSGNKAIAVLTNNPYESVVRTFAMASHEGCALDSDCADGKFCFHGACTSECSADKACAKGTCSSNGRCVIADGKRTLDEDLEDQRNSDVVDVIAGADVVVPPQRKVCVKAGADTETFKVVTSENYGDISYVVTNPVDGTVSELIHTGEPVVSDLTQHATYEFSVPGGKASLGEYGEKETVTVETSIGSWEVHLVPKTEISGLYGGYVQAQSFAGVSLPIRFALETVPNEISEFDDIQELVLYLPSSGQDLFSPEVISDASQTVWSKVNMKKQTKNCMAEGACWVAEYSTNDYTFPSSRLIDKNQKINRTLRIEINGFDSDLKTFDGMMRDIMAGVYREVDKSGKMQWAKARMDNNVFLVKRQDKFDASAEGVTVVEHDPKTEALRDLEAAEAEPADVCSNDEVKALMAFAELEGCSSLTTLSAYKESENARACLMDAAGHLLDSEDMVSTILQKLIPKEAGDPEKVHGFASLQEFMEDCVKPDGICKERREIVCAVDLLGRSYLTSGDADKEEILAKWHQLMRESYLGHQFSAWQKDVDVRRKWLESADTPDFLKSSVLEKINTDMLEEWERDVFDAHRDVLERQFNQGALEVLTRVDKSSEIISNRDMILSEFAEAWEGLSDTLSLGLRRYDELYTGTTQRKGKAAQLRPQLFDLYYSGLVETAINRATGNNSLNGSYGKNLAQNVNKLKSLDQSFDDLVFMRDAEVVTSTSVDPNSGNPQVLSERKAAAKEAVAAAQARRDKVFDNYENKKINQAQINATLSNSVDSLLTELVNLCGMPKGCVRATDPHCEPNVTGGYCGFDLPYDTKLPGNIDRALDMSGVNSAEMEKYYADKEYAFTDEELAKMGESDIFDYYSMTGTGEVAEAILAYRSAVKAVDIAKADYIALSNKVQISKKTCEAYKKNIDKWNARRQKLLDDVHHNIEIINEHYDNITQADRDRISMDIEQMRQELALQNAQYDAWDTIAAKNKKDTIKKLNTINGLTCGAMSADFVASAFDRAGDIAASWGEEWDNQAPSGGTYIKGTAKSISNGVGIVMDTISFTLNVAAQNMQTQMEINQITAEYNLEKLDHTSEIEFAKLQLDLQEALSLYEPYADMASCEAGLDKRSCVSAYTYDKDAGEYTVTSSEPCTQVTACHEVSTCNCEGIELEKNTIVSETSCPTDKGCKLETTVYAMGLDQWVLSEQNAIDTLDEINDTLRELFEIQDTYDRDVQDLEFKRDEYRKMAQDLLTKREQLLQAEIMQYSALKHYYTVLQRASSIKSQYDVAKDRLAEINNLYATPAAIFSFASDLDIVESKIELAKERIYDYLAAVEYLSVRPFVDLRRATYLARSTNDLDKIIDQVDTIVSKCGGGKPNVATVEISTREMMGITTDFAGMSMAERFQSVIAKGNIPINSLTRYTVDKNLRTLVSQGTDLRSGTFAVTIDKSMNLSTTCNAKIDSIAVKIVGEDIIKDGAGSNVTPTITVFYDGHSQLVSCQPNIAALVSTIGDKTSYGEYSTFTVEPTKISPTAKINEYGEANGSLAGKPFATSYTVLIDTQVNENPKIDWNKVEDIMLKVSYTYQDLFPNSSACVSL